MCAVSMIMDHFGDKWQYYKQDDRAWWVNRLRDSTLQADIDEFRKLLERAREYDRKHNQPDCELQEKRQRILDLAKELGVAVEFV